MGSNLPMAHQKGDAPRLLVGRASRCPPTRGAHRYFAIRGAPICRAPRLRGATVQKHPTHETRRGEAHARSLASIQRWSFARPRGRAIHISSCSQLPKRISIPFPHLLHSRRHGRTSPRRCPLCRRHLSPTPGSSSPPPDAPSLLPSAYESLSGSRSSASAQPCRRVLPPPPLPLPSPALPPADRRPLPGCPILAEERGGAARQLADARASIGRCARRRRGRRPRRELGRRCGCLHEDEGFVRVHVVQELAPKHRPGVPPHGHPKEGIRTAERHDYLRVLCG